MLVAMVIPMTMVMECHSPSRPVGAMHPVCCGSFVVMGIVMAVLILMVLLLVPLMVIYP